MAGGEAAPDEIGEILVRTPRLIPGYLHRGPLGSEHLDADGYFRTVTSVTWTATDASM